MPEALAEIGERLAYQRGFKNSFSAYIAWLIERDSRGDVERERVAELRVAEKPTSKFQSKRSAK